jgi:hypothetical protein
VKNSILRTLDEAKPSIMSWSISNSKTILGIPELEMFQMKTWDDRYRIDGSSPIDSSVPRRLFKVPRISGREWNTCPIKLYYKPPTTLRVLVNDFGKDLGNISKTFFKICSYFYFYSKFRYIVELYICVSIMLSCVHCFIFAIFVDFINFYDCSVWNHLFFIL